MKNKIDSNIASALYRASWFLVGALLLAFVPKLSWLGLLFVIGNSFLIGIFIQSYFSDLDQRKRRQ